MPDRDLNLFRCHNIQMDEFKNRENSALTLAKSIFNVQQPE